MRRKILVALAGLVLLVGLWVATQFVFAKPYGECVEKPGEVSGTL